MGVNYIDEKMAKLILVLKSSHPLGPLAGLLLSGLVIREEKGEKVFTSSYTEMLAQLLSKSKIPASNTELLDILNVLQSAGCVRITPSSPTPGLVEITQMGKKLAFALEIAPDNEVSDRFAQVLQREIGTDWHRTLEWLGKNMHAL